MHKVVSRDGKVMTQTIKGADAQGRPVQMLMIWERRFGG
jgi:hypothetical protein